MVKPEKVSAVTSCDGTVKAHHELPSDIPPQIPPRMKKRGPALPEKPPHMRVPPSHYPREPLKPKVLSTSNIDNRPQNGSREVLVAASKSSRERPAEKRQREPAKLLMPTSTKKELSSDRQNGEFKIQAGRKSRTVPQPIMLIPRNMLAWGSAPVSYALWMQRNGATPQGSAARREPVVKYPQLPKMEPPARSRSSSVTRSGSLTSQGSSSSDSGNETFPKSVLKKQKRALKGTTSSCKKLEQKKNVTFNAFATVQLMEE